MGPLSGFTIIELAGIGPGPFCGMMLADMGARVIRVDRTDPAARVRKEVASRGKESIAVNLKDPRGVQIVLGLCEQADALIEGFRPGVTERLGVGPESCRAANPRLVYGRMTGWGQDGPLAMAAGHDINYISIAGALHAIGPKGGKPVPPLNLIGDFGGGGMLLAFGILAGMLEAQKSGRGQVVDAAMVDGTAALMGMFFTNLGNGSWVDQRGSNSLDGGAHYYSTYETADGKYISIGSIEPQFYAELLAKTGLQDDPEFKDQRNPNVWTSLSKKLADVFATKTRDEWCQIMEGSDVCFAPVLSITEVQHHPHNQARGAYQELDGFLQPAPAPRYSRTSPQLTSGTPVPGGNTRDVLADYLGYDNASITALADAGAIRLA